MVRDFPPEGATDCHIHVVYPQYHMASPRAYTPKIVRADAARKMMRSCGIDRVVLVQMSVFGADNGAMLEAMAELGAAARGVVQLDGSETAKVLDAMHAAGVRGVRINLHSTSANDIAAATRRLEQTAETCKARGWHVQLFAGPKVIMDLKDVLDDLAVPVVLDHFGMLPVARRGGAEEHAVLALLRGGNTWVKLSAPYRLDGGEDEADVAALARDLQAAAPDRVVWASDWPHTPAHSGIATDAPEEMDYRPLDTPAMVQTVARWFPDTAVQTRILVSNPARLYDF